MKFGSFNNRTGACTGFFILSPSLARMQDNRLPDNRVPDNLFPDNPSPGNRLADFAGFKLYPVRQRQKANRTGCLVFETGS